MVLTNTFHLRQPHEYLFVNFLLIFQQMKHECNFGEHMSSKNQMNLGFSRESMLKNSYPSDQRVEGKRGNLRSS